MAQNHLLLIGFGNMGQALYHGWRNGLFDDIKITIYDPYAADNLVLRDQDQVLRDPQLLQDYVSDTDIKAIFFAVKPQIFQTVIHSMPFLLGISSNAMIISIMAGVDLSTLQTALSGQQERPIIRTMPNTPAMVGEGCTVGCPNDFVTLGHKKMVERLFQSMGHFFWVDEEEHMHAVTAVSGSGPAYVFYFVEALEEAALAAGLPEDLAKGLARQTVIGAGALLKSSDEPPTILRERVTSPGGTTEAGLSALMAQKEGLSDLLKQTINAAKDRSEELSS